jgi:(R,R)-butanediol dehydrogenase / meso-butanediol dehydrogenase / diacetyl reductase
MGDAGSTFKALRLHGQSDIRLDELSPLQCGRGHVRLRIAFCGICGTDLKEYTSGPIFCPKPGETHPLTGAQLPVVLGHEFSGTVVEVGEGVTTIREGDNVTVMPNLNDAQFGLDRCFACTQSKPNLCVKTAYYGLNALSGGFSQEAVVDAANVFVLPASVSLQVGALVEPLAVAWHMVHTSGFQPGQDALVLGAGPIGLGTLLVLKVVGARRVLVTEVLEKRKQHAYVFGADEVVDPSQPLPQGKATNNNESDNPVVLKAREISSSGAGVNVAFDASGLQSTLNTAIAAVQPGGTIFNVAIHSKPLSINPNDLAIAEKRYMGGIGYTAEDFNAVITELENGSLKVEKMVTSVVPLADAVQGAFHGLLDRKDDHIKILVRGNE